MKYPNREFTGSKNHPRRHHNTKGERQVRAGLCELQVKDMAKRMGILYGSADAREAVLVAVTGRKTERVVFTNDRAFCDLLVSHGIAAQYINVGKWQHYVDKFNSLQPTVIEDEA